MKRFLFALMLPLVTLAGCSNKYVLSEAVLEKYTLTTDDLLSVQFYISNDVVLTKYETKPSEKATENGVVSLTDGQKVDQVLIKAGTKGQVVKVFDNGKVGVSFEPDDTKYLVFGRTGANAIYRLQAIEWKNGRGQVQYGDAIYYTHSGADDTMLTFKLKHRDQVDREMRVAKGNKVK